MIARGRVRDLWRRFRSARDGSVMIEATLLVPVLLIMTLGVVEAGRFLLAHQKTSAVSTSLADLVAQAQEGISESEMLDLLLAAPHIASPYDINRDGRIIITSVRGTSDGQNQVLWQRCTGDLAGTISSIGVTGDKPAALPNAMSLPDRDTAIVAEVWFEFEPLFLPDMFPNTTIRYESVFMPRFGELDTIEPDIAIAAPCI